MPKLRARGRQAIVTGCFAHDDRSFGLGCLLSCSFSCLFGASTHQFGIGALQPQLVICTLTLLQHHKEWSCTGVHATKHRTVQFPFLKACHQPVSALQEASTCRCKPICSQCLFDSVNMLSCSFAACRHLPNALPICLLCSTHSTILHS